MDKTVIVAVIAALTSLAVAIIGLLSARATARQAVANGRSIELLKQSIAAGIKTNEFADTTLAASLEALKQGMRSIQNVKDEIQLICASMGDGLDTKQALARLEKARDGFLTAYQDFHAYLGHNEAVRLHDAKGIVVQIVNVAHQNLSDKEFASELSDDTRRRLLELRGRLTEQQNTLRDVRTDYIVKRTLSASEHDAE